MTIRNMIIREILNRPCLHECNDIAHDGDDERDDESRDKSWLIANLTPTPSQRDITEYMIEVEV